MRKKYLRFEQMEVFRPMPVPQSFIDTVRHEVWVAWQFLDVIHRPNANTKNDLHHRNTASDRASLAC